MTTFHIMNLWSNGTASSIWTGRSLTLAFIWLAGVDRTGRRLWIEAVRKPATHDRVMR